ncbi:MAG: GspE/PulE family protein [Opitutaceae bacterium]|nr:GspE/PulE family protein [Opitutaceae bacterium]
MRTAENPVIQLALAEGLLTPAQIAAARARLEPPVKPGDGRPRLLDVLIQVGLLDGRRLARVLAEKHGLPLVDVCEADVPPEALSALPRSWAEKYTVLPLARRGAVLRLAISDPFDFEAVDGIGHLTRLVIEPAIAPAEEIRQAIRRQYDRSAAGLVQEEQAAADRREASAPAAADDEAPVIRLVQDILRRAVGRRASDIHFEPLGSRFRVRYRIDGVLQEAGDPPVHLHRSVVSRLKIMANMNIAEKRLPQDGRARFTVEGRMLDLRVSSLPTVHGESVVLRMLEQGTVRLGLAELGLHRDDRQTIARLLALAHGMVLVTGPTGSGKTTTLYACLHHLNQPDRKIITVEDPVEYQLAGVNQVPVRAATGMSFAAALRAMLRQAPNIIMVGEIRDRETAEIAINAALTGHLVFSTLHTNDAAGAVTRLIDLGVPPFLVASALRGIVAQRLVRRICPRCIRTPSLPETSGLVSGRACMPLHQGAGCPSCEGTGYRGRVGLFELLTVDEQMQRMIHEGAGVARLRGYARALGMHTLRQDGLRKAGEGLTTVEEVLASTVDDANGT